LGAARRKDFYFSRSYRDLGFSGCVDLDAINPLIRRLYGNTRRIDSYARTGKTDLAFDELRLISPGWRLHESYFGVTSEPECVGGIELDIYSGIWARCDAVIGLQRRIDEACDLLSGVTAANGNFTFYGCDLGLRIGGGNAQ